MFCHSFSGSQKVKMSKLSRVSRCWINDDLREAMLPSMAIFFPLEKNSRMYCRFSFVLVILMEVSDVRVAVNECASSFLSIGGTWLDGFVYGVNRNSGRFVVILGLNISSRGLPGDIFMADILNRSTGNFSL